VYEVTSYSSFCLAEQSPQREKFRTQIAEHGHATKRVRSNADASDRTRKVRGPNFGYGVDFPEFFFFVVLLNSFRKFSGLCLK
jgi:hypothetical protein